MEASDDAFGILQLSASAVSVAEHYVGPIINVTRVGGIFADVSVKFRAVPLTARVSKCWAWSMDLNLSFHDLCVSRQTIGNFPVVGLIKEYFILSYTCACV